MEIKGDSLLSFFLDGYNKDTYINTNIRSLLGPDEHERRLHYMNKRLLALFLSLTMLFALSLSVGAEQVGGQLVILHTNDMHGSGAVDAAKGVIGYAAISQYKKDLEAEGHSVLLLDAGDASQGTPLVNLGYGKNAIEFMNAAGYQAMALGNHEFDWGSDNAKPDSYTHLRANETKATLV